MSGRSPGESGAFITNPTRKKGTDMKLTRLALLSFAVMLMSSPMVLAQAPKTWENSFAGKGMAGLGAGLALIGAGWGFGRIGAAALESMARQPEIAGRVQTGMIVIAALLEGATFFALLICIQVGGKLATDLRF